MEEHNILLLLLSLSILFLFPYLMKLIFRRSRNVPPGSMGWPFLGETLDFYSKVQQGAVDDFVGERCSKYSSNVFKTSLLGHPMVVLSGVEGNKFLFSNEKKLFKHWWPSAIDKLFPNSNKTNSELMQTMRRFMTAILQGDALREYVRVFDATMKQQLETDWNTEDVTMVGDLSRKYTFTSACRIFLGVEDPVKIKELEEGIKIVATGLHSAPINFPGSSLNRAIRASKNIRKDMEPVIRQKKMNTLSDDDDIVSRMIKMSRDDNGEPINDIDMSSQLTGVMQAAYFGIHTTITNVMKYLAELPQVYDLVLREQQEIANSKGAQDELSWDDVKKMKYSWDVTCEVLRLLPPVLGGFKEALIDFNYQGHTIPKGWKMHWNTHATHKNPKYFPDPHKFDPSRFEGDGPPLYTFVPFGGGSRMCTGSNYTRMAVLIFLHNVATKFRWEKHVPDEQLLHDPLPRPAQGLPVHLHPHHS